LTLLFDENLSPRLASALDDVYPGSMHVHDVGLGGATDSDVWAFERQAGLVIVTKDVDFQDLGVLLGAPPKVICIRRGNCSTDEIATMLRRAREAIASLVADPDLGMLLLA
jgi:predicted nuclease of predicted toxin-antitoxin system